MTSRTKQLVQTSFEQIRRQAEVTAGLFYGHLFELNPALEKLVADEFSGRGPSLMQVIAIAVNGLDRLDEIVPLLHELGARYAGQGLEPVDYETVCTAWLWTLERGLGEDFTAEVRAAWIAVYEVIAGAMKTGAGEAIIVTVVPRDESAPHAGNRHSGRQPNLRLITNRNLKESEPEMSILNEYETLTGRFASTFGTIVMMIGFIVLFSAAAHAATFHVVNTNDSGPGSLREAIIRSNLIDPSSVNLIDFQILPAGGVKTISLQSQFPDITTPVVIDGTTQSGYAGAPVIELDGSNADFGTSALIISAGNSTVKGLAINRFSGFGISLQMNGQNVIAGNYFGLDSAGTTSLPISGVSLHVTTPGNLIGGTTPAERNVISGSNNRGIYFVGSNATGNLVKGNYIGTDASGTASIGNSSGIAFNNAPGNTIGGTTAAERNVISGNGEGIDMTGPGTSNNVVTGNYIGTKADGTSNLQNVFYGVHISNGAHSNAIGGTPVGEGNVIAYQTREIALESNAGSGNTLRGNSFFSSGQIGIDLGNDAVTANDAGDADTGANDLQNYPVITSAVASNGNVSIIGTLNSIANKQFNIDFYSSPALTPQGNAEARTYLTSALIATDGSGNANLNVSVPVASLTRLFITATATDDNHSTSELSLPAQVAGLNGVLQFSAPTYSVNENGVQATIAVTRTNGNVGFISVHYATSDGTAKQPGDYTSVSGTLSWPDGDASSQTFNIPITDNNVFEQSETVNLTLSAPKNGATLGAQSTAVLTILDNEQPPDPADLVVTNTNDSGSGSLRQAITTANGLAGTDTISFNIQPAGVHTITPLSALPDVTDAVVIDATTQPGFASTPVIELNGASAGQNFVVGLTIKGGSSTVKGFVINRFTYAGIMLASANNIAAGNFIGIDVTGNAKQIGSVSMANNTGISIGGGPNSNNNVVGGTTASARNVIANNQFNIDICCQGHQSGNKIVGNYIGTNAGGTAALGNSSTGIRIDTAPNTVVGGTTPAERNVISGNSKGISLSDDLAGTLIQGNYIGTKADGTTALGNQSAGILTAYGVTGATIGGTASGASNVIAFNGIGNAGDGGISISNGLPFTPGKSITVSQNAIFSNNGLGVDLGSDGVTTNDAGDGDNGPNDLQNFPALTSVTTNGSNTVVQGTLNSEASRSYHIELFSNTTCSSSGFGQGQFFVAATDAATDASGNASFTFTVPTASITGTVFTATATNPNQSTSEFSVCASGVAGNPGVIQFSANSSFVNENAGNVIITVTRTGGSTGTVKVDYATANGSATSPADYTQTSGTLTFLDGETSKTISVSIPDDSISEPQRFFSIGLSNPTGGATLGIQLNIQVTISDNDAPSFSINDVQVTEGNSGTTDAVFTVSLQRPHFADAHVDFATLVTGTATSGTDYQPTSGTLTFLKGETTRTITVKINGDSIQEPNETFTVKLSNNDVLSLSKNSGTGTIIDDDAAQPAGVLAFSAAAFNVNENSGVATITVKRTGGSNGAVSAQYASIGGTATVGSDYATASGTVNWADGDTADKTFSVTILDDQLNEPDETVNLSLTNPTGGAVLANPSSAVLTIIDNDAQPSISIKDVSQVEGNSGTTNFVFDVSLSAASGQTVTVSYGIGDDTATVGSDYQPASGTLMFAPGETSKTITVLVNGDPTQEPDETFFVNLSLAGNATITKPQGVGTIINDDSPAAPTVQFSSASYNVQEDLSALTITVTRTGDTSGAATVDYVTNDGSATQKSDFEYVAGTLTFAPGDNSKTFQVLINEDSYVEGTETVNLVLSNPTGSGLGVQSNAVLSINDDASETITNPVDDSQSFIYLHYHDFLNREPDAAGLAFWTNQINACGTDVQCIEARRVDVSASFFLSIEFQETAYLLYLMQKESYSTVPVYASFMRDLQEVSRGVVVNSLGWQQKLADNQQQFADKWVSRPEFKAAYDALSNDAYVSTLYKNAGIVPPQTEKDKLVGALNAASTNRSTVLLEVASNASFRQQERNKAFVLVEYFGYLRRDPNASPDSDLSGYNFWLNKLNQFNGNYVDAEMIKAFITSFEYRQRFAQ